MKGILPYYCHPSNPSKTSILGECLLLAYSGDSVSVDTERMHRSLRSVAMKALRSGAVANMPEALQLAVRVRNATFSRAIGTSPDRVTPETYPALLLHQEKSRAKHLDDWLSRELKTRRLDQLLLPSQPRIPIGSRVRLKLIGRMRTDDETASKTGVLFKEHSTPKFSSQLYTVIGWRPAPPTVSYIIANAAGKRLEPTFDRHQLLIVSTKDGHHLSSGSG